MKYKLLAPMQQDLSLVEQVFVNRGININDIDHYLHTSVLDIIDPATIANIKEGVTMLVKHIWAKDKILVQVDSDCDGFTSAACLLNYLNCIFPSFTQHNITYRLHTGKEHGIIVDTIPEDVKLVIAPDSSSNDYEQHQILSERGVDVLVIDHHDAEKISEYACVINNQLCDYPTKSLSGVGMVYKFCCYMDQILQKDFASNFLDLVAVGLVGDMMDLRDFETKELIEQGLNNVRNPYIKAMRTKQDYSISKHGYFDPFAVAFYIVPLINATIRAGSADEKIMLFESMLDWKAYDQIMSTKRGCKGQKESRVDQAVRNCANIKNRQTKANDDTLELIARRIKKDNLTNHKILLVKMQTNEIENHNLTGLVANQLASKYQQPTLVLNRREDLLGNVTWEGSGRNFENSPIDDFRMFLMSTNLVMYAEGHGNAFGVGIIDELLEQFINTTDILLKDYIFQPCYSVDVIHTGNNFNPADVLDIAALMPLWGQNLKEPMIALENLALYAGNVTLRSPDKYPTLVIKLSNGVELIKFGSSQEEYEQFNVDAGCIRINVVGRCDRNIWNDTVTPQIKIVDYEIVGANQYYF